MKTKEEKNRYAKEHYIKNKEKIRKIRKKYYKKRKEETITISRKEYFNIKCDSEELEILQKDKAIKDGFWCPKDRNDDNSKSIEKMRANLWGEIFGPNRK